MTGIYIPTRARPDNLRKIIPRWLETTNINSTVFLVVDKSEAADTRRFVKSLPLDFERDRVAVLSVADNVGIGAVRAAAVKHAARLGFTSIIMSDDDLRPAVGSQMNALLRYARRKEVLGIGATRAYHDFLSGGATKEHDGPILCPSGWGLQTFALNIPNALKVGNFDVKLDCFGEDAELMRAGLAHGFPWLVHCGVKCEPIGKRYEPGGLAEYTATPDLRKAGEQRCQKLIHARWPDFTSRPPSPSRVSWQKMYNHFIPNWREKSAMHGGSL